MAKEPEQSSFPWAALVALLAAGSGLFLFFPGLGSSRPGATSSWSGYWAFDDEDVSARHWQDPLAAVEAAEGYRKRAGSEATASGGNESHSLEALRDELASNHIFEDQSALLIMPVMIPTGPYVEFGERRLRSRQAILEALGRLGYAPEEEDHIGCLKLPLRIWDGAAQDENPDPSSANHKPSDWTRPLDSGSTEESGHGPHPSVHHILIPYERCEPTSDAYPIEGRVRRTVLVLWLPDEAFRQSPFRTLADLLSWFQWNAPTSNGKPGVIESPDVRLIGPHNSEILRSMIAEASRVKYCDTTKAQLASTHIFSPTAGIAEALLFKDHSAVDARTSKAFLESKLGSPDPQSPYRLHGGFAFDRTNWDDSVISDAILKELPLHGDWLADPKAHVAIISELDTFHARSLQEIFLRNWANMAHPIAPHGAPQAAKIHPYIYLRGIDGKLPAGKDQDTENSGPPPHRAAGADTESWQPSRQANRPEDTEGLDQADYVRRLAAQIGDDDAHWRHSGESFQAVGVLGSDVYDKLELLEAIRPKLPYAVFFTNGLDARFALSKEWPETHNLIVVSIFSGLHKSYFN